MNLELLIARRLLKGDGKKAVSVPIVRIAMIGIVLGMCVILLSVFIITGFKKEITDKLSGFAAHLNIVNYDNNVSFAGSAIVMTDSLLGGIRSVDGVKRAYVYVTKPAILKSKSEIHGVVFKGVDSLYNADFFRQSLQAGAMPDYHTAEASNEILLSATIAGLLDLQAGDKVNAHFVQDPPRIRVFTVKGVYNTGFKEYDDIMVVCDMRHLQRLNDWQKGELSGVAIELQDIERTEEVADKIDVLLPWEDDGSFYKIKTLQDQVPQVFEWLGLLNTNVWVILVLIILVAGFNMVSGLLILILDKASLIGVLKALGYRDVKLRKLFLYVAAGLIGKGMLWGNVLALLIAWVQDQFRVIKLDPVSYYMDAVPINIDWLYIILLNVGVLAISVLMLIIPTMLIASVKPIKIIQFD